LFVLVTTSNSPDIIMPAYNRQGWYSVFFVIYLIINLYMFMGVFLAVVYNR
jgi:two pore calcium channel protein 3